MSFFRLVSASLASRLGFLFSSYGRLFIEFLLSQITDDTVARAFSFEATKCAFNVLVFSDFNRRHSFSPTFADAFILYLVIITIKKVDVKSFFAVFVPFYGNFQFMKKKPVRFGIFLSYALKHRFYTRTYTTFSKSSAGCLHQGQMKSSGNSSPS